MSHFFRYFRISKPSDRKVPPEEVATVYEYIVTRSLWDVLEEL